MLAVAAASAVALLVVVLLARNGTARGKGLRAARSQRSWAIAGTGGVSFAAGACRAFAPVGRWNGRTVFLDPGHGGPDSGAVARVRDAHLVEKRLTLAIARAAVAVVRRSGFRVVVSRTGDSPVARLGPGDLRGRLLTAAAVRRDIVARTTCANAAGADALVGIHLNSFDDANVTGAETFYNPNRWFSPRSRRLAQRLQSSLVESLRRGGWSTTDRGVATDGGAGGIPLSTEAAAFGQLLELGPAAPPWFRSPSAMPGAIVEPLFLTNPDAARIPLSPAGRDAIARGLARGLARYFDGP